MNTYKLYQVAMLNNAPICTYVAEVQATDIVAAETALLQNVPSDVFEYMILVVK